MWSRRRGKNKEARDDGRSKMLQVLGCWAFQIGMPKY